MCSAVVVMVRLSLSCLAEQETKQEQEQQDFHIMLKTADEEQVKTGGIRGAVWSDAGG